VNITDVITLIGAIATFLFGMSTMTDGLEKLSSGRPEGILERLTSNVFRGVLLGALVTGPGLALEIVDIFLDTPFSEEERHSRRVSQLEEE